MSKKVLILTLTIFLCFSLSACGKSEELKNFESVYSTLPAVEDISINYYDRILYAEETFNNSLQEKEKKEEVKQYFADAKVKLIELKIDLLNNTANTIFDLERTIESVEKLYYSLDTEHRNKISNYSELEEAKKLYERYKKIEDVDDLILKALTAAREYGEGERNDYDDVKAAREAYNNLSSEDKELVSHYSELEIAELFIESCEANNNAKRVNDYLSSLSRK